MLRDRAIRESLTQRIRTTPVTILQGARQVGKSTLVSDLLEDDVAYRSLDHRDVVRAAQNDPGSFVAQAPGRCLIIDEAQKAPDLIPAIKAAVDEDRTSGRFVLTGSADLLWARDNTESLAGRATTLELGPYSQGELTGRADDAIVRLMAGAPPARTSSLVRSDYLRLALRGGYPVVHNEDGPDPTSWLDDYVLRIQRDVAERGRQRRIDEIPDLLRVLAARQAQELNVSSLAKDLDLKGDAIRRYLRVLEHHFLVRTVPAFAVEPLRAGVKRPKALITDTGLAGALLGLTEERLAADAGGRSIGALLEAFVTNEVARQLAWTPPEQRLRLRHYRNASVGEVDLIVEDAAGNVVALEVKASSEAIGRTPSGMRALREALGSRFVAGIVLYTGSSTIELGDRTFLAPIDLLWSSGGRLMPLDRDREETSNSLVGDARVFWSYAHADDERDGGRIRRLASAVKQEYEFLTGGEPLELFIDEDLRWGDRWRDEINRALDRTTLFVAVVSPTYVRRPECQREFEDFVRLATRAGEPRILLPLRYGPVPDSHADPVANRLIEHAKDHQWVDLETLRFEDEASAPWRRMVHMLATALVERAQLTPEPVDTAPIHDDQPDLLELQAQVADFEPALDNLLAAFQDAADVLTETIQVPDGVAPDRAAALLRQQARQAAEDLDGPLTRLDSAVDEVSTVLDGFDQLLIAVASFPAAAGAGQVLEEIAHGLGVDDADFAKIEELRPLLHMMGTMSRDLRTPMRRLDRALTLITGMRGRIADWQQAAERALRDG